MTLEERLQSRFEWGLMADIQQPDLETRKAILQTKAEENNMFIPDQILETIAHHVRKNIRELEGALNKVMAYSQLSGRGVDEELVHMALADLIRQPQKLTIEQVMQAVCQYYQVTHQDMIGDSRKRTIAFPRQMAMYLARTETDASLPLIGTYLGDRDHSTVLYGYEKISIDFRDRCEYPAKHHGNKSTHVRRSKGHCLTAVLLSNRHKQVVYKKSGL